MSSFRAPSFQNRIDSASDAKKKALDQLRARPAVDEQVAAERLAKSIARQARDDQKAAAKKEAQQAAKDAKAVEAAKKAAKAAASAPRTEAELKAARDARYAARKARK